MLMFVQVCLIFGFGIEVCPGGVSWLICELWLVL
jgi:hypothetical protein